jgi:hypothetical protein
MTEPNTTSDGKLDMYSKQNRWYYARIDGNITDDSRKLLEEYSHIPAEDVDNHIYKMVFLAIDNGIPYPSLPPKIIPLSLHDPADQK